jgi:hypothetical protein
MFSANSVQNSNEGSPEIELQSPRGKNNKVIIINIKEIEIV